MGSHQIVITHFSEYTQRLNTLNNAFFNEVINQACLTWFAGCHCQLFVVAQHVDQRRFADVGSSDKSELWELLFRLLGNPRAAARK